VPFGLYHPDRLLDNELEEERIFRSSKQQYNTLFEWIKQIGPIYKLSTMAVLKLTQSDYDISFLMGAPFLHEGMENERSGAPPSLFLYCCLLYGCCYVRPIKLWIFF
jgi:hypothetical protein